MRNKFIFCFVLVFLQVHCETCPDKAPGLTRWSTWTSAGDGSLIVIPSGTSILYDLADSPVYAGIEISGSLIFEDTKNLKIRSEYIAVLRGGLLQIGAACCPFTNEVDIILHTGTNKTANKFELGTKSVGAVSGGSVEIHGVVRYPTWTKLSQTANVGDTIIYVMDNVSWVPGDKIVLPSTDFEIDQAEELTVTSVSASGKSIGVSPPLQYMHYGQITQGVDERGEVGLLSRNIRLNCSDASVDGFGVHFFFRDAINHTRLSGVEIENGGQKGVLGRYPIHFHMAHNVAGRAWVHDCSIHHSFSRCLTVHATDGLDISGNVAFETLGHCYFLEDGIEQHNVFSYNLGINAREVGNNEPFQLLPSDSSPAVFWITNPTNDYIGNVAAGSDGFGYWMAFPENPTGPSTNTSIFPYKQILGKFNYNVAHSIHEDGLMCDKGPEPPSLDTTLLAGYVALTTPSGTEDNIVEARMYAFTAYKCENRGAWIRGNEVNFYNSYFADSAIGVTFAFGPFKVLTGKTKDTIFVGESDNIGTPKSGRSRSYPKPDTSYPIRGFELYDGPVSLQNVKFSRFVPNAIRNASCISSLRFNPFPIYPTQDSIDLQFLDNSNEVFFGDYMDDGDKNVALRDLDGTLTSRPPQGNKVAVVVTRDPFYRTSSCVQVPSWLAQICPNHFAQLQITNGRVVDTVGWTSNPYTVTVTREDGGGIRYLCGGNCPRDSTDTPNNFMTTIMMRKSYIVRFEHTSPTSLSMRLNFANRFTDFTNTTENWIVVGVCYPTNASLTQVSYDGRNNPTPATSLNAMRSNSLNTAAKGDGLWFRDTNSGIVYFKVIPTQVRNPNTIRWRDPSIAFGLQATNIGNTPSLCSNPATNTVTEVDPGIPPVSTVAASPAFATPPPKPPRYPPIQCDPGSVPTSTSTTFSESDEGSAVCATLSFYLFGFGVLISLW